ncbi:helix-turn-helix transcriptional regulator [Tumebacillus flagellatus]|uniref:HTH cro/C1-type domain-containing protein n=1 Tax=Tumebacillus flagellatus TaxID=1157490 RepID=A0A074M5V7_9BACL|nr:helix-turn-helix transcriptional regulator [Tumebacillus flagellatus]KEO81397.1 hypothetical protein EL26_20905 [Tumebacillus flagellatus]
MSTIEHTASVTFGKIPLGRRIAELMQERGDAFSIRAFSERLGVNRETFRLTLLGERPISISLLEDIAKGLKVDEDRLRQRDTFKKEEELTSLLNAHERSKDMMLRAETLACELVDVALGLTERCICWANLGRAQYYLQEYDLAHESFLTAMSYAEKVNESFGDSALLYHVTSYIMVTFTIRKEYTNIVHTLNVVENAFANDAEKMGYVHFTRMKWYEHRGNLEEAKKHSYLALEYFEKTHKEVQIGKAYINVAHYEYHLGNYQQAREILNKALVLLHPFEYPRLFAIKEYAKTLLKLGERTSVNALISEVSAKSKNYTDLHGKLQILSSMSKDDPSYAIAVSDDLNYGVTIRWYACKYLMEYYASKSDSESLLLYYMRSNTLKKNFGGLIDEEGF